MNPLLLDHQLCFALYTASRALTQAYQPLLAPLGLTYPQYLTLLVLWEDDDLPIRALRDRLQLDASTLSPLLKRLERQGLVSRQRDASDERIVRIALTQAGHDLRARALPIPAAMACNVGLDLPGLAALRDQLHALTARLHTPSDTEPNLNPDTSLEEGF